MGMTFTAAEKAKEAAREVNMRARVYPKWVADKGMSEADAARKIELMMAIAEDYRTLAEQQKSDSQLPL